MSNFKNVLKVYTMMRAFDADDNALLNTLRNATEAELESLAEAIGPVKRTTAKRTRKASKSPRAASLAGAIGGTARHSGNSAHYINENACVYRFIDVPGGKFCGSSEDSPIHDPNGGYSGYHKFIAEADLLAVEAAAGGD